MTDSGGDPERLLSSALRAQASGNVDPAAAPPSAAPPSAETSNAAPSPRRPGLPVLRVLLLALALGLVAGGIVGVISVL